jgi:Tfp pilus assembly protein PilN
MKLRLNLATAPAANNRPFLAATTLVGTLGLLALALLSHAAYSSWQSSRELRADTARWEAQIRADRQKQQELQSYFHSAAAQEVFERSEFLNSLIDERSFPWTQIFMDLEQTLPPGVRVVSISPRLVNGRAEVALEVGSATDDGKIQFLRAIEKSKMFSGLVVKDERRSEQPGAADKIVLSLTVWYSTI